MKNVCQINLDLYEKRSKKVLPFVYPCNKQWKLRSLVVISNRFIDIHRLEVSEPFHWHKTPTIRVTR